MARLTIISDPDKPSFAVDGDVYTIGRSKENNLVLNNSQVSRRHAQLRKNGDGFRILDLDSMNGVYVNNLKVKDESLAHGDIIQVGDFRLLFEDMRATRAAVPVMAERSGPGIPTGPRDSDIADIGKIIGTGPDGPRFEAEILYTMDSPHVAAGLKIEDLDAPSHRRKLLLLYQVSSMFNSALPLDELFQQVLSLVFKEVRATEGAVFVFNKDGALETRVHAAAQGPVASDLALARAVTERALKENSSIACAGECFHPSDEPEPGNEPNRAVMCTLLQAQEKVLGAVCLENLADAGAFKEDDLDLLTAISNQVAIAVDRELMQETLKEGVLQRANLERFHSPDVVSHILHHSAGDKAFRGALKEREVTVLFADIADFTSLIERLDPQEAADLLNEYFDVMTAIVFKYKGTVDKFIGDAVMGIFGAPISYGNDAELAVFSAIEMMQAMPQINAGKDDRKKFDIRIGINTGVVLSGYMGSRQRIEYTVLGDPVNVAARLQHIAEPKAIFVGADTYAHVKGIFKFHDRGTTVLRGKKRETRFYEVIY